MDYLKDIGPFDEPPTPDTGDDTPPPPPPNEDTEEDESVWENKLRGNYGELEEEPIAKGDPRGELSVEYELEQDPGREEPLAEYEPKEDPMEEEDPEEDPKEDLIKEPLQESNPEEDPIEGEDP